MAEIAESLPGLRRRRGPTRRVLLLAALLGLGFCLPAVLAPVLAPHDPLALDLMGSLAPPDWAHPLGRDEQGADILSRLIFGARISLVVGVATVAVSASVGIAVGLLAGYAGGWLEQLAMRVVDVLLAFPGLLLAIGLVAVLGPGLDNVVIALSALGWTGFARLVRGQVLSVKARDYVQAAASLGAGHLRLMTRHILPNILAPVLVQASFAIAGAILSEASLSFLGLGAPPGTPSWGAMLAEGRTVLVEAPFVSIFPGLAIMAVVLGFNLLGDAINDWLDPRRER
jgi:peptide/nickel transport system permease protein